MARAGRIKFTRGSQCPGRKRTAGARPSPDDRAWASAEPPPRPPLRPRNDTAGSVLLAAASHKNRAMFRTRTHARRRNRRRCGDPVLTELAHTTAVLHTKKLWVSAQCNNHRESVSSLFPLSLFLRGYYGTITTPGRNTFAGTLIQIDHGH